MKKNPKLSYKIVPTEQKLMSLNLHELGPTKKEKRQQLHHQNQDHSSQHKKNTLMMSNNETKIISLKQTLGLAMKSLIQKNEQLFNMQMQKQKEDAEEEKKLVNFFFEVSKDIKTYEIKGRKTTVIRTNTVDFKKNIQVIQSH